MPIATGLHAKKEDFRVVVLRVAIFFVEVIVELPKDNIWVNVELGSYRFTIYWYIYLATSLRLKCISIEGAKLFQITIMDLLQDFSICRWLAHRNLLLKPNA